MNCKGILFLFSAMVVGAGCHKKIDVDDFFPTLKLLNRDASVRSGESLRFRVDSNHDTYILESLVFDSRLDGDFPVTGKTYTSGEEFSIPVTVRATHKGTLALRVGDPITGRSEALDVKYTAYNLAEFSMTVLSTVVCDGDDFSVRVSCTHDSFELRTVDCPFIFDGFQPGRIYAVGQGGYVDLTARKVTVRENGTQTARLVVVDSESGTVSELTGTFETRKPTVVSMSIVDADGNPKNYIYDHDNIYLRVYDTQESFQVEDFYCEFGNLLSTGGSYKISSDGFLQVTARDVRVSSDHDGSVTLALYDPVHKKTHRLSVDYCARVSR